MRSVLIAVIAVAVCVITSGCITVYTDAPPEQAATLKTWDGLFVYAVDGKQIWDAFVGEGNEVRVSPGVHIVTILVSSGPPYKTFARFSIDCEKGHVYRIVWRGKGLNMTDSTTGKELVFAVPPPTTQPADGR